VARSEVPKLLKFESQLTPELVQQLKAAAAKP
jgi:hypothetical protein